MQPIINFISRVPSKWRVVGLGALSFTLLFVFSYYWLPIGYDFRTFFYPAGKAILYGESPYAVEGFFNPPWSLIILAPLALFPLQISWAILFASSLLGMISALLRLRARGFEVIFFLLSPPVLISLWYGNLDFLVMIGMTLSPALGIWLISLKPQMGIGLAIFWAYQSLKSGRKDFVKSFGLFGFACIMTLITHLWQMPDVTSATWNVTGWPWAVLPGMILLSLGIYRMNPRLALSSSPFLSPYSAPQSWMIVFIPGLGKKWVVLGFVATWLILFSRAFLEYRSLLVEAIIIIFWGFWIIVADIALHRTK